MTANRLPTSLPAAPEGHGLLSPRLRLAIISFCIIALISLLLAQMAGTAFTCDDDMFTATARFRWGGFWKATWAMATGHGRFYHLFVYPLAQLPYLLPGFALPTAFRVLSAASVFAAFFLAARGLLRSAYLAAFLTLVLGGLIKTTHMFNPVHALPMWFNLGFTFLLTAVYLFSVGLTSQTTNRFRLSGLFVFLSLLFYETFLPYVVLFPLIAFLKRHDPGQSARVRMAMALNTSTPVFVATGLWMLIYFAFRSIFPPQYRGGDLALGPPVDMLSTLLQFSLSGLNLDAASRIPWEWNVPAAVGALLAGVAFFLLLRQPQDQPSRQELALMAALGVLFAFVPNVIYPFTPRYRTFVKHDVYYLGSFYAAFSLVFTVGVLFLSLQRLVRQRVVSATLSGILALIFSFATYANHLESARFFGTHRANRHLWDLLDHALSAGLAQRLRSNAVLVAPQLMRLPELSPFAYDYWSYYLTQAVGRPIQVMEAPTDTSQLPDTEKAHLPRLGSGSNLWGLAIRYSSKARAGFIGLGKLDYDIWCQDPTKLLAYTAHVWVTGDGTSLRLVGTKADGQTLSLPVTPTMEAESPTRFDLATFVFEKK